MRNPDPLSLDGKSFAMTQSSNSRVDPQDMSRFNYSETDGVVWGDFVGGVVQTGQAESVIVVTPSGLRLDERFIGPDGKQHTSVCEQRLNR